jgi:hypothetical protein
MKRDKRMRNDHTNQQIKSPPGIRNLAVRLLLAALCGAAFGQGTDARAQEFQAGVDFLTVLPRGEFKDNIKNNGYGVGGHFLVRLKQSPILVGIDLGGVVYGSETRKVTLLPDVPEVRAEVTTGNNIFLTHFLVRAQPRHGVVRPYADGLIGFKYLFTNTSINIDSENSASETNLSDLTLSYGFGGGVQVRLNPNPKRLEVLLDGKVRYLRGSPAEYLREGSIRRENGAVFFDVLRSRTDVVTAQVGITFRF